jgi:hypothetical protein
MGSFDDSLYLSESTIERMEKGLLNTGEPKPQPPPPDPPKLGER